MNKAKSPRLKTPYPALLSLSAWLLFFYSCHANDKPGGLKSKSQDDIAVEKVREVVKTIDNFSVISKIDDLNCIWYYADNTFRQTNATKLAQAVRFKCSFRKVKGPESRDCQIEFWSTPKGKYIFAMDLDKGKENIFYKTHAELEFDKFTRRNLSKWLHGNYVDICQEIIAAENTKSHGAPHGSSHDKKTTNDTIDIREGSGKQAFLKSVKQFREGKPDFPGPQ